MTIFRRTGRGVTVTNDGAEFLQNARHLYSQYESLMGKYSDEGGLNEVRSFDTALLICDKGFCGDGKEIRHE